MGRDNDALSIGGTTVRDKTKLKGGKGANSLTTGTGNSLANSVTDDFTPGTNTAPTIDLNTVTSINENGSATLTGTFTDANVAQTHSLVFDWGDANNSTDSTFFLPATSNLTANQTINSSTDTAVLTITAVNKSTGVVTYSVQHRYADDGAAPGNNTESDNSTATVTVSDGLASASDSATITVTNVLPTITDPANTSVNENSEVTLSTTITDPGTLDRFTATVDWGDGQTSADSISLGTTAIADQVVGNTKFSWNPTTRVLTYKHTYLDDNPTATTSDAKTVTVTVRDDDSTTVATQTTTVTVNNVLPTITDPANTSVNADSEVTLSTTVTDPGTLDAFTATVNWGDGQTSADSINLGTTAIADQVVGNTRFSWNPTTKVLTYKHTYLTGTGSGPKTVTVTVRDDDAATDATQTTTVTVNVVP
jgi:large repetitive protein